MTKCNIEAADLGLNENDKAIIDEQITKAREANREKANVSSKIDTLKKELEKTRQDKKSFEELSKKDSDSLIKSLDRLETLLNTGDPIEDADRFDKLQSKIDELQEKVNKKKAIQSTFKQSISTINASLKSIRDYKKLVLQIEKSTRNNLINKIIKDDLKGARASVIKQELISGKKNIDDMLVQSEHPNNLYSNAEYYQRRVTIGTKPYVDDVRNNSSENSLASPELKELIAKVKQNIANEAKSLDIEDEFSPMEEGYHPISMNQGILARMFYGKSAKPDEFKADCLNAFGVEELDRIITNSYEKFYRESEQEITIPTTENVFKEFERQVLAGHRRILSFNDAKFLSDNAAEAFIRKYSGNSIAGSYAEYARNAATTLSSYKIFGRRYVDDNLIKNKLITKTDKQVNALIASRDAFYGNSYLHPAKLQRQLEFLSKTQRIIAMSHGLNLVLSPFGDEMIGATLQSLRTTNAGGFMSTATEIGSLFAKSIQSSLTGGALKYAFNKNILNETDEFLRTWNTHAQYRYSYSLGNDSGRGLNSFLMNYFEHVDNGLRAGVNRSYTNLIKRYDTLSFDGLKSENESLYNLMKDTHGIDSDEWDLLRQYVRNKNYMDAADFANNPSMMRKIVSMEYQAKLSGIPNAVITSDSPLGQLAQAFSHKLPKTARMLGMFWQFFGKSMLYSWRMAQRYSPYSSTIGKTAHFFGLQAAGSFVPNYLLNIAIGAISGRKINDILNDPETYISASLGPIGRLWSISSALTLNQSDLGYALLSSPMTSTLTQGLTAASKTVQSINNPKINPYFYWLKAVFNVVPFARGTAIQGYTLNQINPKYEPRHGEKFAWQNS